MKRLITLAGIALAMSTAGFAAPIAPCASGTFATYIAIASTGCSVDALQLSGFSLLPTPGGSTSIAASAITVNPIASPGAGLQFVVNENAGTGQLFEAVLDFNIAALTGGVTGAMLTHNGASATGDAAALATETFCLGGSVNTTGVCTGGTPGARNLGAFVVLGMTQSTDALTFGTPRSQLGVTVDLSAGGGNPGSASLASVNAQFTTAPSAVPEPVTFLLSGGALLGLVCLRRRRYIPSRAR